MGPPGTKVFVGNLPEDCDKEHLQHLFESVGHVAEFDIIKNYAFLHFFHEDHALRAVEEFNNIKYNGKFLKVEMSRSLGRHKPGMGTIAESFHSSKQGNWPQDCPYDDECGPAYSQDRGRGIRHTSYEREPPVDPYFDYHYKRRIMPPSPYDRRSQYDDDDFHEQRRIAMERDPYFLERERYYCELLAAREAAYCEYYARRQAEAFATQDSKGRDMADKCSSKHRSARTSSRHV